MIKNIFLLSTLLIAASARSETIVVKPPGTIQAALLLAQPGDTVLVPDGEYNERLKTVRDGTWDLPITVQAEHRHGARIRGADILNSYITIDGFESSGPGLAANYRGVYDFGKTVKAAKGANVMGSVVRNCWIHDVPFGGSTSNLFYAFRFEFAPTNPTLGAKWCEISGNTVSNLWYNFFLIQGVGHIVRGNDISANNEWDIFRIFGVGHRIEWNNVHEMRESSLVGNHTDLWQSFGDNDDWSEDIIIDSNRFIDCQTQICQMEQKGKPHMRGWIIRNNLFSKITQAGNCGFPECQWLNNTFYQCTQNTGHPILLNRNWKSNADGATVTGNIFWKCGSNPISKEQGFYLITPGSIGVSADRNYAGPTPKNPKYFIDKNGVNGGDVQWVGLPSNPHPQDGSILIDAIKLGTQFDIDGVVRPVGNGFDIGAHEQ